MDLRRTRSNDSGHKVFLSITSALASAVLEWMLMFMIFVDASFAYLVTRFACRYQLQIPCLLCSRLDHVLGNERAGFYWDLICHNHKLKISSLVLCRLHNNLVDVRGTCENCDKSDAETYRSLVSKLVAEPYNGLAQDATSDERNNEPWISKTCSQNLFQRKSIASEGAKHDDAPSIAPKYNGDEVQEITEETSQLGQMRNKDADPLPHVGYREIKVTSDTESEGKDADPLPHVGYREIKVTSDTESEGPFSENENAGAHNREMETSGQESVTKYVSTEPQLIVAADFFPPEKLIHPAPPISLSEPEDRAHSHRNVESEAPFEHGLAELNWQQADYHNDGSEPSDLISFSGVHPSPNANGIRYVESNETNATSTTELEKEVHIECGEASNPGTDFGGELRKEVNMECRETSRVGSDLIPQNEIQMDLKPNKTNTSSQVAESLDLGDAYKLALGPRSRQLSGRLLEQQRSMTDSTRASEDLKLWLSQISAGRGIDSSVNDISPRVSANSEDVKATDAFGSIGMQIIQRRISLERNESNLSLDGSTISEIEGESVVDRLKRQVEHDKKILCTLYKELEEERSASAIAANQAMAMITRLQEEKAAFHMEALQCLRMMEEQAEYDGEALQKASELLAEKDKQIQDFEFELESYRNQFGPLLNRVVNPGPESESDELKEQKVEANGRENCSTAFSKSNSKTHEIVERIDGAPKMLDEDIDTIRVSLQDLHSAQIVKRSEDLK